MSGTQIGKINRVDHNFAKQICFEAIQFEYDYNDRLVRSSGGAAEATSSQRASRYRRSLKTTGVKASQCCGVR